MCPICERAFNQKVVLREHIRWVHAENKIDLNPIFQCELCEQILRDREELCAHIVRHSDQISIKNKTNISTTFSANKKKLHVKNSNMNREKKRVTTLGESTKFTEIGLNFSCDLCGLSFKSRQLLKSHIIEHF